MIFDTGTRNFDEIEGFSMLAGDDIVDLSGAAGGFNIDGGAGSDTPTGSAGSDTPTGSKTIDSGIEYDDTTGELTVDITLAATLTSVAGGLPPSVEVIFINAARAQETAVLIWRRGSF